MTLEMVMTFLERYGLPLTLLIGMAIYHAAVIRDKDAQIAQTATDHDDQIEKLSKAHRTQIESMSKDHTTELKLERTARDELAKEKDAEISRVNEARIQEQGQARERAHEVSEKMLTMQADGSRTIAVVAERLERLERQRSS